MALVVSALHVLSHQLTPSALPLASLLHNRCTSRKHCSSAPRLLLQGTTRNCRIPADQGQNSHESINGNSELPINVGADVADVMTPTTRATGARYGFSASDTSPFLDWQPKASDNGIDRRKMRNRCPFIDKHGERRHLTCMFSALFEPKLISMKRTSYKKSLFEP